MNEEMNQEGGNEIKEPQNQPSSNQGGGMEPKESHSSTNTVLIVIVIVILAIVLGIVFAGGDEVEAPADGENNDADASLDVGLDGVDGSGEESDTEAGQ